MTTPTNWPNPERLTDICRPPEGIKSETYHWLDCGYLAPFAWREGDGGAWWSNGDEDALFSPAQMSDWGWKYVSPCLTPAQIAEMLAGERERAAQEAIRIGESWNGTELSPTNTARTIAHAIRNLGAAP